MQNLSIQAVAKILGLTPFILRAWEKRYKLLKPKRSDNGRRAYSLSDVEKLRLVVTLKQAGHSLTHLSELSTHELYQLVENSNQQSQTKQIFLRPVAAAPQVENLLTLVKATDLDQLANQLKILQLRLDTRSFLLDIVSPLLQSVGSQVMKGELEIFHEHAISALIKHLLTGLLYTTERATDFRGRAPMIFATPEGDLHEFGILIAAILALINGHPVFYLGPNMPAESLAKAAHTFGSTVVVMACSAPRENLSRDTLRKYHQTLRSLLPPSASIWSGGERNAELQSLVRGSKPSLLALKDLKEFEREIRLRMGVL